MRINIIDANSDIKVISMLKEDHEKLPKLDVCVIESSEIDASLKLVALRRILSENAITNADINIFLLSTQASCLPAAITNSIEKSVVDKQKKELLESNTIKSFKDSVARIFKNNDASDEIRQLYVYDYKESDYTIHSLLYSVSALTIKDYNSLARTLNLKNVVLTDYEYLGKLNLPNYNVVDIGRKKIKTTTVVENKVVKVATPTDGTDALLKALNLQREDSYSLDEQKLMDKSGAYLDVLDNIRKMRNDVLLPGMNYVVGGGSLCHMLKPTNNKKVKPLFEVIKPMLSDGEIIPEPLYAYISSMLLVGCQSFSGDYPYNILGSQLDIKSPIIRKMVHSIPVYKKVLKYTVATVGLALVLLLTTRGIYSGQLYNSTVVDLVKGLPASIIYSSKIEKIPMTDISVQTTELTDLYSEVSDKIMAFDELQVPTRDGTKFNTIYNETKELTTANLTSLTNSDGVVTINFKGYLGDVPKVEKILQPHYVKVEYKVTGVDDFSTFTITNFVFTCYE